MIIAHNEKANQHYRKEVTTINFKIFERTLIHFDIDLSCFFKNCRYIENLVYVSEYDNYRCGKKLQFL